MTAIILACYVFYIVSEKGKFRVGVRLGAPVKVQIYINYFYFLQMLANH